LITIKHTIMNLIEFIVTMILFLWIVALGVSFMLQRQGQYMTWTSNTLRQIWRNAWQFIVGIAIGYFASGPWFQTSFQF
jgi:hypothetical protein